MAMASLAVAVSLLAAFVHATIDFVWYVPAYAAALAVLAGLIRSLAHKSEGAKGRGGEGGIGAVASSPYRPVRWITAFRPIGGSALTLASIGLIWIIGTHFVQAAKTEYARDAYYRLVGEEGGGRNANARHG